MLTNVYDDGNKGGAAITILTIEHLKALSPGMPIIIVPAGTSGRDEADAFRHTLAAHPDVGFARSRRLPSGPLAGLRHVLALLLNIWTGGRFFRSDASDAIRRARVVIGKGGQGLRGAPRAGRRKARKALTLISTFHPALLAQRLGLRNGLHGVTIGPFSYMEPSALVAARLLRRSDRITVRTEESLNECLRFEVPSDRLDLAPDIVFSWQSVKRFRSPVGQDVAAGPEPMSTDSRYLAVTVRTVKGYSDEAVVDWFSTFLRTLRLLDAFDEVIIIRHASGRNSRDHAMATRICDHLESDMSIRYDDRDFSPETLIAFYENAEAVIGGRVHSAIFGLVSGTLAFPVDGYFHAKASDILESIEAHDLAIALPKPGADLHEAARDTAESVNAILDSREDRLPKIEDSIDAVQSTIIGSLRELLGS